MDITLVLCKHMILAHLAFVILYHLCFLHLFFVVLLLQTLNLPECIDLLLDDFSLCNVKLILRLDV